MSCRLFLDCCHAGSSAQIVCGIFIAVLYIKLYSFFGPYKEVDDDVLQEMTQYQVFVTLFISLLIRVGTYCTVSQNRLCFNLHYESLLNDFVSPSSCRSVS